MLLYHGTTESAAKAALEKGLKPRGSAGVESNWEECPSSPHHVYLTSAYAGYFAMASCKSGERWAIIEVDTTKLDQSDLFPDEDFLEQASRNQELPDDWGINDLPMNNRTEWFRNNLGSFQHLWEDSVKHLGNCSHFGQIPTAAITKVAFIDPDECLQMTMLASDPMITLMNFKVCGNQYRAMTRWFIGEEVDAGEISSFLCDLPPELAEKHPDVAQQMKDERESYEEILSNRAGVEIINIGGE